MAESPDLPPSSLPPTSSSPPSPPPSAVASPSLLELLIAFTTIAVMAFGGALPWARRKLVEQKRWMTADEFNDAFALSQFLPGPNVINFSVVFGSRFRGPAGAAVALLGLMGPPVVFVIILAALYARYGEVEALARMLAGVTAAAAGLFIAMTVKMAEPIVRGKSYRGIAFALAAFLAIGVLRWPLPQVLMVLIPVSIAVAFFWGRR
jgi:chromate transporter